MTDAVTRVVRSSSITPATLTRLCERSDAAGLRHLLLHLAALCVSGWLVWVAAESLAAVPALLLHGVLLTFLFAPLHESIHYTAFARPALNRAVAWFAGFVLILPPRYFRAFHLAHHHHTADPARDPELTGSRPSWWWGLSGGAYWTERIGTLIRHAGGRVEEPYVADRDRARIVSEARALLAGYAALAISSVALGSALVLWLWVLPALIGQPFLRAYLLAEHHGCDTVPDMLANSRSIDASMPLRFLCWNMCYHAEHHAYAAIPFHRLPEAHRHLADGVHHRGAGYPQVLWALFRRRRSAA